MTRDEMIDKLKRVEAFCDLMHSYAGRGLIEYARHTAACRADDCTDLLAALSTPAPVERGWTGEQTRQWMLDSRGVPEDRVCEKCHGFGARTYSSTATWRGGVGGMTITTDVCDRCWGSGRSDVRWPSHRTPAPVAYATTTAEWREMDAKKSAPVAAPPSDLVAALRHALWNLAGSIVAVCESGDEHMARIACSETSPLVDGARDAIERFGLSNETAVPLPEVPDGRN